MKKITVNELFAGIGAFRKALINQNIPHEIVGISEIDKLSDLGYTTEWKVLIASDYGIPQRRERVFAVSVRKDKGGYSFPEPMLLEKKFRDLLEEEVEGKYFLRKEMFEYFERHSRECGDNFIQEKTCNQVGMLVGDKWAKQHERSSRVWGTDSLCPTLTTCTGGGQEVKIIVQEATKKGYAVAEKGDSIDIAYINQNKRRARVDKERAHTITTSPQIGTLTDHGVRKLTPRECWRLMGFTDSDFNKAQAVCSDTQLYKQAGNSIVVQVLEGILKNLIEEVEE